MELIKNIQKLEYIDSIGKHELVEGVFILQNDLSGYTHIISQLKNTKSLTLIRCNISDISFLRELKNLEFVNLNNNQISDISILNELPKIKHLYIEGNQISDISVLPKLHNLKECSISDNPIIANYMTCKGQYEDKKIIPFENGDVINEYNHFQKKRDFLEEIENKYKRGIKYYCKYYYEKFVKNK